MNGRGPGEIDGEVPRARHLAAVAVDDGEGGRLDLDILAREEGDREALGIDVREAAERAIHVAHLPRDIVLPDHHEGVALEVEHLGDGAIFAQLLDGALATRVERLKSLRLPGELVELLHVEGLRGLAVREEARALEGERRRHDARIEEVRDFVIHDPLADEIQDAQELRFFRADDGAEQCRRKLGVAPDVAPERPVFLPSSGRDGRQLREVAHGDDL